MNKEQTALFIELTRLQQHVALAKLNGDNLREAYRVGGGKATSENSTDNATCIMLSNPKVKLFIASISNKLVEKAIKTKYEKLLMLEKLMDKCLVDDTEKGVINAPAVTAAIKEHNLMMGDNAPTELKIDSVNYNIDKIDPKKAAQEYMELIKNSNG